MKRMTPEVKEAMQTSVKMQSVQSYGRDTAIMLMEHIAAVEYEFEAQLKVNKQLIEELDGRKVRVPRKVAVAYEALRVEDDVEAGWTVCNIIKCPPDELLEPAQVIKNYFVHKPHELLKFFVHGYTVEQTPEDRISAKLTTLLFELNVQSPIKTDQLAKKLVIAVQESLAEQQQTKT